MMSTEQQYSGPSTGGAPATGRSDFPAEAEAKERADVEEDRRRQRVLDDGELGGEA